MEQIVEILKILCARYDLHICIYVYRCNWRPQETSLKSVMYKYTEKHLNVMIILEWQNQRAFLYHTSICIDLRIQQHTSVRRGWVALSFTVSV